MLDRKGKNYTKYSFINLFQKTKEAFIVLKSPNSSYSKNRKADGSFLLMIQAK